MRRSDHRDSDVCPFQSQQVVCHHLFRERRHLPVFVIHAYNGSQIPLSVTITILTGSPSLVLVPDRILIGETIVATTTTATIIRRRGLTTNEIKQATQSLQRLTSSRSVTTTSNALGPKREYHSLCFRMIARVSGICVTREKTRRLHA